MKPETTSEIHIILQQRILDAQKIMNNNLSSMMYADYHVPTVRKPTVAEKISWFVAECKNRFSNAYDCLVKGVDPYDW